MRRYILHDLDLKIAEDILEQSANTIFIPVKKAYSRCTGCFGCWLKTPGECTMKD